MQQAIEAIEKANTISVDFDGVIMSFLFGRSWKSAPSKPRSWFYPFEEALTGFFHRFRYEIPECRETLAKIKGKGKKMYVLTVRNPITAKRAKHWLKHHGFEDIFDDVLHAGFTANAAEFKAQVIKDKNIDLHIDDDFTVISGLNERLPENINLFLFHNKKTLESPRIAKVEDWVTLNKHLK